MCCGTGTVPSLLPEFFANAVVMRRYECIIHSTVVVFLHLSMVVAQFLRQHVLALVTA
jgi:hypothetical protein